MTIIETLAECKRNISPGILEIRNNTDRVAAAASVW
jgi:hypothetical protein